MEGSTNHEAYVATSIGQAAKLCKISRGGMQKRIDTMGIGRKVDGRWCFTAEELARPVRRGAPKRGERRAA